MFSIILEHPKMAPHQTNARLILEDLRHIAVVRSTSRPTQAARFHRTHPLAVSP